MARSTAADVLVETLLRRDVDTVFGTTGDAGFESDKYDVSMKAAERVLRPRVRSTAEAALILADGFSCREQIEQGTRRRTMHIAELMAGHMGA